MTDRGLEVLRHLPNLRAFDMTWQRGITDIGVANLRFCDQLERVNLMGSPTGDGAIKALQGKLSAWILAAGLPELDRVAFRIGQPGEASVRVDLRVQFDHDAAFAELGDHLVRSRTRKLIIHWRRRSPKYDVSSLNGAKTVVPALVRHGGAP